MIIHCRHLLNPIKKASNDNDELSLEAISHLDGGSMIRASLIARKGL
jgi:hypothetical protein